jgi:hypothetical protein
MNSDPAKLGGFLSCYPALSVLGWYLGDIHFLCTFPCVLLSFLGILFLFFLGLFLVFYFDSNGNWFLFFLVIQLATILTKRLISFRSFFNMDSAKPQCGGSGTGEDYPLALHVGGLCKCSTR